MNRRLAAFAQRYALALALIASVNGEFWALGAVFSLTRPFINLDLTIALLVMGWSRAWGSLALLLAWFVDGLVSQSLLFHFNDPAEFLAGVQFLKSVDIGALVTPERLFVTLPFAVVLTVVSSTAARWRSCRRELVMLSAVLFAADIVNGSSAVMGKDSRLVSLNIVGSPIVSASLHAVRTSGQNVLTRVGPLDGGGGEAVDIVEWAASHPHGSIVLVLVESMGLHRSSELRAFLRSRLYTPDVAARWALQESDRSFKGSTTYGELHVLCSLYGPYRALTSQWGRECVPSRLTRLGWSTVGVHGFTGSMFDRKSWWTLLGLQRLEFLESTPPPARRVCGVGFRGLCDEQVVEKAFSLADGPAKFAYVLTLNTHLPLEPEALPAASLTRCRAHLTGDDVCLLMERLGDVLAAVSVRMSASRSPLLVVITGDHAPPFANRHAREQFDAARVPTYVLTPRATAASD